MNRTLIVFVVMALLAALAQAADSAAFAHASGLMQKAAAGDNASIEPALTEFKALSGAEPADPVLRAYLGAATSMQAVTTMLPWRKMGFAEDGLAQIDKALAQLTPAHDAPLHQGVPASLETRFVAASTFLNLPGLFNRGPRGTQLLAEVTQSPLLAQAPLGFRGAVWLRAAREAVKAQNNGEARQWLDKVIAAGAPQATVAQAQLKGLQ